MRKRDAHTRAACISQSLRVADRSKNLSLLRTGDSVSSIIISSSSSSRCCCLSLHTHFFLLFSRLLAFIRGTFLLRKSVANTQKKNYTKRIKQKKNENNCSVEGNLQEIFMDKILLNVTRIFQFDLCNLPWSRKTNETGHLNWFKESVVRCCGYFFLSSFLTSTCSSFFFEYVFPSSSSSACFGICLHPEPDAYMN